MYNAVSSAGSVAGPKFKVRLSAPLGKTYETLKPEWLPKVRSAKTVSRTVDLSLPREIETLRFCRQKLIDHKSAPKTVPGEDNEVDVRINAYRPNPDGVRFVSANQPSMRHMRMPATRMPTGQDPRMSETRNQKSPTPSITKILVTPLRVTSLRRSSNVVSAIRTSNQIMLYTDTFALDSISKSVLTNPPFLAWQSKRNSPLPQAKQRRTPVEGYAFRGFHYITAMVQLFFLGSLFDLCFDTGCTMSLIDRNAEIKKMSTPMTVKGIG